MRVGKGVEIWGERKSRNGYGNSATGYGGGRDDRKNRRRGG